MNNFAVLLFVCVVAVHMDELWAKPAERKVQAFNKRITLKQCLIEYNVDPVVLEPERSDDPRVELSDEKKSCVTACVYRAFNWLRPDGTFDIDLLTDGKATEETEATKKKYLQMIDECRSKVGKDDCKFFRCLDEMST